MREPPGRLPLWNRDPFMYFGTETPISDLEIWLVYPGEQFSGSVRR
jgi:hypothetical protein